MKQKKVISLWCQGLISSGQNVSGMEQPHSKVLGTGKPTLFSLGACWKQNVTIVQTETSCIYGAFIVVFLGGINKTSQYEILGESVLCILLSYTEGDKLKHLSLVCISDGKE